jgi:hypothetical protein
MCSCCAASLAIPAGLTIVVLDSMVSISQSTDDDGAMTEKMDIRVVFYCFNGRANLGGEGMIIWCSGTMLQIGWSVRAIVSYQLPLLMNMSK